MERPKQELEMLFCRVVEGKIVKGSLQEAMVLEGLDETFLYLVVRVLVFVERSETNSGLGRFPNRCH